MAAEMKIKSPEEMKELFAEYLQNCQEKNKVPNISGFAVYCGVYRDYFNQLQRDKEEQFGSTVRMIIDTIADLTLDRAYISEKNQALSIFLLKNYGYTDKTEQDINIKGDISFGSAFGAKKKKD